MMLAPILILSAGLQFVDCAPAGVRTGVVRDVETAIGVADAVVSSSLQRIRSAPDGRFTITAARCDTLHVRRLGYRARSHALADAGHVSIDLHRAALPLAPVETRADQRQSQSVVRGEVADARSLGGSNAADLAATLPFVGVRSVSGRTALSLRGSRSEQVLVTLDGVALNDPATGTADLADIPLAALGGAVVSFGSGAAVHGSGASGGVIALQTGSGAVAAIQAGSHGSRSAEGAWTTAGPLGRVRIGASLATADDDFTFRNVAAASPADTVERRVNNDSRRASGFVTASSSRYQLLLLHSDTERGLAGPMNVRAFDRDRGRTARTVARVATAVGTVDVQASVRVLAARYANAGERQPPFTVGARSAEIEGALPLGPIALRAGAGADRVHGSTLPASTRARSFAAASATHAVQSLRASAALRADIVEGTTGQLSPSLIVERAGRVTVSGRLAKGFRIPTFYDIYFASPQRVTAQSLVPERVTLDAELRASSMGSCGVACAISTAASLFERRTRDAIVWFPGNVGWSPQNVPEERARGGEVHLAVQRPGVEAKVWAGGYHTLLRDGYLEMRTPYVPYWSGGATVAAGRAPLSARLHVGHTGRRPFVTGPALPELELPPATVVALGLQSRQATPFGALTLSVSVDDLLDARPELVRRYPTPGRKWTAGVSLAPRIP